MFHLRTERTKGRGVAVAVQTESSWGSRLGWAQPSSLVFGFVQGGGQEESQKVFSLG